MAKKINSYHYEPLNFPPSDHHIFTDCMGSFTIPIFISKHIETPFRGTGLKH